MSETPTQARPTPRWKVIYDQLYTELASYSYGSDFYTIPDVCRQFGVSPITAVRVLNELANRNLIERISGKGSVVRQVTQPVSIRLITPAKASPNSLALDSALRRRVNGITRAVTQQHVEFDTICEDHLQRLFPRPDESFGFLLYGSVIHRASRFLRLHGLPHVLVDPHERYKGQPHARANRIQAGYLATRHLIDLGHRRIACITGLLNLRHFRDRLRGYRHALTEAGIPLRWSLIKQTERASADDDAAKLAQLLDLPRPPTAIITGDDNRAIHVLDACRQRGIDVPGQLSILGYPNNPESRLTDPPLSVIDAHFEKVGEAAVKLLLAQMLEGADPVTQSTIIEPELVERASTAPPAKRRRRN